LLKFFDCFIDTTLRIQKRAQRVVRLGVRGIETHSLAKFFNGAAWLALPFEHDTEILVSLRVIGFFCERLPELRRRFFPAVLHFKSRPQIVISNIILWGYGNRMGEQGFVILPDSNLLASLHRANKS